MLNYPNMAYFDLSYTCLSSDLWSCEHVLLAALWRVYLCGHEYACPGALWIIERCLFFQDQIDSWSDLYLISTRDSTKYTR